MTKFIGYTAINNNNIGASYFYPLCKISEDNQLFWLSKPEKDSFGTNNNVHIRWTDPSDRSTIPSKDSCFFVIKEGDLDDNEMQTQKTKKEILSSNLETPIKHGIYIVVQSETEYLNDAIELIQNNSYISNSDQILIKYNSKYYAKEKSSGIKKENLPLDFVYEYDISESETADSYTQLHFICLKKENLRQGKPYDLMDDTTLWSKFIDYCKKKNLSIDKVFIVPEMIKTTNEDIKTNRLKRLNELYNNFCDVTIIADNTIDTVKQLIERDDVRAQLTSDETFLSSIKEYRDYITARDKLISEKNTLEATKATCEKECLNLDKECESKRKELITLETQLNSLVDKLKVSIENKDSLYQQMIDVLKDDAMAKVIATLDGRDNNTTVPLKEELSPKTIEDREEFSEPKIEKDIVFQDDLDALVKTIREYRNYEKNDIINMLLCISQNFLTVFSGAPGTGKTSFSRILGHCLGLDRPEWEKTPRFITVAVEQGWSSKKDLIGYYNPLNDTFSAANPEVYNSFRTLDHESQFGQTDYPMIILLDEANLSHMEYYWADFMSICDTFKTGNNKIAIDNKKMWRIPETLRFLATINNDHTTETLSPRLLDRAWVVTLPEPEEDAVDTENISDKRPIVSFEKFIGFFSDSEKIEPELEELFKTVCEKLNGLIPPISYRTKSQIKTFCEIGKKCFKQEKREDPDPGTIALDYAISQKVLTRINGNGEEYGTKLDSLAADLNKNKLTKSEEIVKKIREHGKNMMDYYSFF